MERNSSRRSSARTIRSRRSTVSNVRGEGQLGCIFVLALIGVAGYVAFMFGLPYYQNSNFENRVSEMMPFYRGQTKEFIQQSVLEITEEFDFEVPREMVKVQVRPQKDLVVIEVLYETTVETFLFSKTLSFAPRFSGSFYN